MADFDDKLNRILSNPEAMAQIARLAQSLDGPPEQSGPPPMTGNAGPPPDSGRASGSGPPPDFGPASGGGPPSDRGNPVSGGAPPFADGPANPPPPPPVPDLSHGVSELPPPFNPDTLQKFLPLLRDLGGDSDARRLLYALRPYLRPRRRENVERALRLARLLRVGKDFLSQWEG